MPARLKFIEGNAQARGLDEMSKIVDPEDEAMVYAYVQCHRRSVVKRIDDIALGRAMAAALDLLEACREALPYLEYLAQGASDDSEEAKTYGLLDNAIRKATKE